MQVMMPYLLTGLAGIALGIVAMRVWQARNPAEAVGGAETEAPASDAAPKASAIGANKLLIGTGAMVAVALAIFALRPDDEVGTGAATMPLPSVPGGGSQQALDDVDTMINRLAARLEKEPDNGEGFRMLGWSYVMTGKPDKAIAPYQRALKLLPQSALVHSGYGEALTGVGGGKVTPEAKAAFERAVALDPAEPRARYFLALWQAQNGGEREALDKWIVLANSGPADAPWQADVRRQIDQVSKRLGIDVSGKLKQAVPASTAAGAAVLPPPDPAVVQAASQMAPADRQAMIDGMVNGLARKLKANPANPEGWVKLLRSRMVLGQPDVAATELKDARKALGSDPGGLKLVNDVAREIKVPGA